MQDQINTCISGWGVSCGEEVHLRPDCSIEIAKGMIIFASGNLVHTDVKLFRYYVKPEFIPAPVMKFMLHFLGISKINPDHMEFLLLADGALKKEQLDSLKQQHPEDVPEENLMWNRIASVIRLSGEQGAPVYYYLLISRNALAKSRKIAHDNQDDGGLFPNIMSRDEIDAVAIDEALRPVLKLPTLVVPRFGYKGLALTTASAGLKDDNIHNPFFTVNSFKQIFYEYKAIIDEYIVELREAIKTLHHYFWPVLSHKGSDYLDKCRRFLTLKTKRFYEEGDHLYYIQYFYDWLRDLTIAYNELVEKLEPFKGGCPCHETDKKEEVPGEIILLGPVLGGMSSYQPLIFRDLALPSGSDRDMREVRFLHWRLMMMIRTFDLPFLHLEKVLSGGATGIEEQLDATDYWENENDLADNEGLEEFNWLPIKLTPSRLPASRLGLTAIPYYYPVDSNSIYSVHQFWDYPAALLRRSDYHLSYNAHFGDEHKPSTDTVNDSYTRRVEAILPLAFNLEPYPVLKAEGFIGKKLTLINTKSFYFKTFPFFEYIQKYNICLDVIAIALTPTDDAFKLRELLGLEHRPVLPQGHTLVLLFVNSDTEQIELAECRKDKTPEVEKFTVVADFVLPYRYSCCPLGGLAAFTLATHPAT